MARISGCLTGCLTKLLIFAVVAGILGWGLIVALNPWALHIGGRSTPLLYWHGAGTLRSEDGKTFPLYVSFWPGRPGGGHGIGRREGKRVSARLDRPNQQGIPFNSGLFIHHAVVTLRWASYADFEAACNRSS
jgi:hypothetical protein